MYKKSVFFAIGMLMVPGMVMAWTYTANMDSYPSIGGGFMCYERPNMIAESVTDSTAPGPTKSIHAHYPENTVDGKEAVHCSIILPSGTGVTSPLYIQYYFKFGNSWVWHGVINKHVYIYDDDPVNGRSVSGILGNRPSNTYGINSLAWNPASIFGRSGIFANVSPRINIEKGKWYKVNIKITAGTPNGYNGTIKAWLNDTLQIDATGVPILSSDGTYIKEFSLTPVWGGFSKIYSPTGGMDQWFDMITVSSEPISGSPIKESSNKIPLYPILRIE